jgi:integrase/recombinase XerC/integrase/recombinase XerD
MNDLVVAQSSVLCPQSLDSLIDRFLNSQDIKQTSKTTYRRGLKNFFSWLSNHQSTINNLTRETILEYKRFLEARRGSPLTLSTYLTAVRRFFEWAESMKIYPNVARGIRGSKKMKGFRKEALTVPQCRKLLVCKDPLETVSNQVEELRDLAMVNLMVHTGLRTIEVIRADVEDIRQEGGEAVLWIQGKGRDSKDDLVVLTEECLKPIRDYLKERGDAGSEPLFTCLSCRNRNGRLTTRSIRRIIKARLKSIGIESKRITAHSLRHTAVTLSLLGGAKVEEAQKMARHSSIETTMIYAHHIDRITRAPERRIDDVLSGSGF